MSKDEKDVPDKDVAKIRDDPTDPYAAIQQLADSIDAAASLSDPESDDDKAARLRRDKVEAGALIAESCFNVAQISDEHANAFGDYDPNETAPQAAEFYRYSDPSLEDGGYI